MSTPATNPRHFNMVDRVYAQALLELAQAENTLDEIAGQMADVAQLLAADADVVRLLSSRTLALADRDQACVRAFDGKVAPLLARFLRLLVHKDRFDELPTIAGAFLRMVEEHHGDLEVQAITAAPLTAAARAQIETRLGSLTGRHALVREQVDPAMLGGLTLRVHDAIVDGSVATQLRLIKQALLDAAPGQGGHSAAAFIQD